MPCSTSTEYIFDQINDILCVLTEADYVQPLHVFNGSTLGQHCRHIIDFYRCVIQGAFCGEVNYACRDRSSAIENNIELAQSQLAELQRIVRELCNDEPLKIVTDFHQDVGNEHEVVQSSIGRELMYAYDHAIHHLAMIKIGIKENFSYVDIDRTVGLASSTINHGVPIH